MAENIDIKTAAKALNGNAAKYQKSSRYYDGDHDLSFATEKFENAFGALFRAFSLNMCPAVCDAVRDKLRVTGFRVEAGDEKISEATWKLWQDNRMGKRAGEIHREAMISGDAYAIVWVDPDKRTTIYPNRAGSCTVVYDEETPGKILWAAKYWLTRPDAKGDKRARLNLFYPDRIEKYISVKKVDGSLPDQPKDWAEYEDDGGAEVKNPYGVVPVFHFGNNADIGSFGKSEISQVIPVQDALNKSVLDMLVAMEFAAFRQRWASGIEIEYDDDGKAKAPFTAGVERLWVSENPEVKFGDFEAANLEQFLKVKDGFRVDVATVSGTPLHYFMLTGASFPQSGISIEKLESRFLAKVRDRMESFGQVWEDLMSFALRIDGKQKDIRLFTEWQDPAPLSEKEQLENILIKKEIGISDRQALVEAGYGEEDIDAMEEAAAKKLEDMSRSFNAGEDANEEAGTEN